MDVQCTTPSQSAIGDSQQPLPTSSVAEPSTSTNPYSVENNSPLSEELVHKTVERCQLEGRWSHVVKLIGSNFR